MADVPDALLDAPEGRDRRRTVVIYKSAAEAPPGSNTDGVVAKEKLASHKNLMYSEREAELIEDLTRFLIEKQPSYVVIEARNHNFRSVRLCSVNFGQPHLLAAKQGAEQGERE